MSASSPAPPRNLVLIGFMGCGKTTVGRKLQHLLGYPFLDTDQLIEARAGKPITGIFGDEGEAAFRGMETETLRHLLAQPGEKRIIATGGGVVIRPENRELLRSLGFVVWLRAPVDTILQRVSRNHERPLLHTENPRERVVSLLAERTPLYQETAHLEVETHGLTCHEVACGILESARYYFATEHRATS
jgi:shikimate kinase